VSAAQDARFSDKQAKLLKTIKTAPELDQRVRPRLRTESERQEEFFFFFAASPVYTYARVPVRVSFCRVRAHGRRIPAWAVSVLIHVRVCARARCECDRKRTLSVASLLILVRVSVCGWVGGCRRWI
jgi:hypothetical protein